MKVQRINLVLCATAAAAATGTASWYAVRYLHPPTIVADSTIGLPPIPDLSRWSPEFREALGKATRDVAHSREPAKALAELARLYQANNFASEAEQVLRALRLLDSQDPRTTYLLGRLVLRKGDLEEAAALFLATTTLQPDYAPAWLQLGTIRMREKRFEEARTCFERRLALVPDDPEASYALAVLDRSRGSASAAIERMETFLLVHPRLREQRQLLVELYEAKGDQDRAGLHRHLLDYAIPSEIALDPWIAELDEASYAPTQLYLIGLRSLNAGSMEKARELLEKAARFSPDDEEVLGALAQTYLASGRADEAFKLLEAALVRLPQSDALYVQLADAMGAQSRTTDAVKMLERRIAASPHNGDLHFALGRAHERADEDESAIGDFREAIRLNPVSTEARLALGRCLLRAGRMDEANNALERVVAMRPDHREALSLMAGLELQGGNLDEAERLLETMRLLEPDETKHRQLLALVRFRKGNRAAQAGRNGEAADLYRNGLEVDPTFGPIHGGMGMLLAKSGDLDSAIEEFTRFAELTPTDATAYLLLGSAHAQAGRANDARAAYQRGLVVARQAGDTIKSAQIESRLAQ